MNLLMAKTKTQTKQKGIAGIEIDFGISKCIKFLVSPAEMISDLGTGTSEIETN